MNNEKINMLSTATIAFVSTLVAMGGFCFNLVKIIPTHPRAKARGVSRSLPARSVSGSLKNLGFWRAKNRRFLCILNMQPPYRCSSRSSSNGLSQRAVACKENIPLKSSFGLEFVFLIVVLFFIHWIKRKDEQ